jgi:hypothetical protein
MKPDTLIWAKGEDGRRHLCPSDKLDDLNFVKRGEVVSCVDDDSRLETRDRVPSNSPEGKIKFAKSTSLN